jgi:VIT1/CCC1 family predicted Fe2+/Mn2+ transporter
MAETAQVPAAGWSPRDLEELEGNLRDERSAEWLYDTLAGLDGQEERAALLRSLRDYEKRHTARWEKLLRRLGRPVPPQARLLQHRILVSFARVFGVGSVLPLIHKEEVEGIAKYKRQAGAWKDAEAQEIFREILPEEIVHEADLFNAIRKVGAEGGTLRSAILGANDGIVSVLALAAGVAGATASSQAVVVAGVAGITAGAFSMAASNYVSVRAEQEMVATRARMQRDAVEVAPKRKSAQLREAYWARGYAPEEAEAMVSRLAKNPDEFARALLVEEYGIAEASFESPPRLAATTGIAFGAAAVVPVLPFFALPVAPAVATSVVLSGAALFAAGVLRSLVTLKPFLRNGFEMLVVGMGAAAFTYAVGLALGTVVG